ncbi:MAG: YgjP-like metallopeptidase domain-containing protein [Pseudomonadota bacterium]
MSNKTIFIEEIGNINLVKTKRAKRFIISIQPFKDVRISIPYYASYKEGISVLEKRKEWIKKAQIKMKDYESKQKPLEADLVNSLQNRALNYLPKRTNMLAQKLGFKVNKISLKNMSSRWGSCSTNNNINLNIQLMRLPGKLIDYVIIHELFHIRHHNHGKRFWEDLDKAIGNSRFLEKELKKYHTQTQ